MSMGVAHCLKALMWLLTPAVEPPLRRNQLHRLPGLPEHLEQHLGLGLEQGDPMLQIGGMALQLTADLKAIAQEHGP